jgi:hypothetical protein
MANKLWYQDIDQREELWTRKYIQELIDLYCPALFAVPEDITPDNFLQFLEVILKQYQLYNIDIGHMADLGDAIEFYFHKAYQDDFPDTLYPSYLKNDRRFLALLISNNCLETSTWRHIVPEDVPFVLECLSVPDDQIIYIEERLKTYFNQFDEMRRHNIELSLRFKVLRMQRQLALGKREPLPIRPMGLELDMCYKNAPNPRRGKLWEYIYLNYSPMLSEKSPDTYEKFLFGSEEDAEAIVKEYDEILINRCRGCGSIKYTPGSTNCSSCGASSEPLLGRK